MQTMTRDVRGPDGWRIVVSFTDSTITVVHFKKEQALGMHSPNLMKEEAEITKVLMNL